jgi:hypothetical protein
MTQDASLLKLNDAIESVCPRDCHLMRCHAHKTEWPTTEADASTMPCYYRCDYLGFSVRYTRYDGYFTVINTPDLPQAVDEPDVNLLECPQNHAWLYRSTALNQGDRLVWRCGVEGCDYTRADFGPAWANRTRFKGGRQSLPPLLPQAGSPAGATTRYFARYLTSSLRLTVIERLVPGKTNENCPDCPAV